MPVAAIDKHRNPRLREDDVRRVTTGLDWPEVDPVAQTAAVEDCSERKLWLGVLAAVRLHTRPGSRGRRPRTGCHPASLRANLNRGTDVGSTL